MVVIKEGCSSQKAFITEYIDKKQKQLENINSKINDDLPFSNNSNEFGHDGGNFHQLNENNNNNNINEIGLMEWDKLPEIKTTKPPRYMKNFRKFIKQTQKHLDQVLANKTKIDFVHDIVAEIQKPLPDVVHMESDVEETEDEESSDDETTTQKENGDNIEKSNKENDVNELAATVLDITQNETKKLETINMINQHQQQQRKQSHNINDKHNKYQVKKPNINQQHNQNQRNYNSAQSIMKQKIQDRYNSVNEQIAAAIAADRKGILKAKHRYSTKLEIEPPMKTITEHRREISFNARPILYEKSGQRIMKTINHPKNLNSIVHDIKPKRKAFSASSISTIGTSTLDRSTSLSLTNHHQQGTSSAPSISNYHNQQRQSLLKSRDRKYQSKSSSISTIRTEMPLKNFQRETFTSKNRSSPRIHNNESNSNEYVHLCPRNKSLDRNLQEMLHSSYSGRLSYDAPVSVINLKFKN